MIKRMAANHRTSEACLLLGVSTSGYYAWDHGGRGNRAQANAELLSRIREVHRKSRGNYGSPRVTRELYAQGIRCGHNRVARIMRKNGLKGAQKACFRPRTTDSHHSHPISPNRLKDHQAITRPNQVWVSDITYIPTREGWSYLSAVMDLGTRHLKGWTLKDSLKADLVVDAFRRAAVRHRPGPGLILHSDRGCQYASDQFRRQLDRCKALGSMSRKGNCYDNAAMESFWATLKTEMHINQPFGSKEEAKLAIFDYIETFYNRQRLHSSIGYKSPADYEANLKTQRIVPKVSAETG